MDFKISISEMDNETLNALDADIQLLVDRPGKNRMVNLMWERLQYKVKEEIRSRIENLKGNI